MKVQHSHSIDDEKYATSLAGGMISFSLDDSVGIKLTLSDIKYLISQGISFDVDLDKWTDAVNKTTKSISDMSIVGLLRQRIAPQSDYNFSYDYDFGKFMFLSVNEQEDDIFLQDFKNKIKSKYLSFLEEISSLRYIASPVTLDNIKNDSKIEFIDDVIHYQNKGFKIVLDKEYTNKLIEDARHYLDNYAEHTFSRIEESERKSKSKIITVEFVKTEGLKQIDAFVEKNKITVEDLKALIEFFYGDKSFESF